MSFETQSKIEFVPPISEIEKCLDKRLEMRKKGSKMMYALARITKYMNKVISCMFVLHDLNYLLLIFKWNYSEIGVFNISMHDVVE